jgi:single-strand DNA-binding protein
LAEVCAEYLRKGRLCAVEGRIQVRHYDNNEGKRVYVTEVVADNVRFLNSGREDSGQRGGYGNAGNADPFYDDGKPIEISEDDLPF